MYTHQLLSGMLAIATVSALPPNAGSTSLDVTNVVKRGDGSSQTNYIEAQLDCVGNNIETTCNFNCAAILCGGKPQVLQRDENKADHRKHWREAGSHIHPFNGGAQKLANRGTSRIADDDIRAAEYPWVNSYQGGRQSDGSLPALCGVPKTEGQNHRNAMKSFYSTNNVGADQWYKPDFKSNMRFCQALASNDTSVCQPSTQVSETIENVAVDMRQFMYVRDSPPGAFIHFSKALSGY